MPTGTSKSPIRCGWSTWSPVITRLLHGESSTRTGGRGVSRVAICFPTSTRRPTASGDGGLEDTIQDYNPGAKSGTGFKFTGYNGDALLNAVKRAIAVYKQKQAWRRLIDHAMDCDLSWDQSAREYLRLYRSLTGN